MEVNVKFSTGFFDGLFGKKTTLQVPQDDGSIRDVPVTVAWLKKMEADGIAKISKSETVPFYVSGPDGSETKHLKVGVDIPEAHYKKLADPETGALYGLTFYESGTPTTNIVPKHVWEQAKAHVKEIDQANKEFMQQTIDRFKDL